MYFYVKVMQLPWPIIQEPGTEVSNQDVSYHRTKKFSRSTQLMTELLATLHISPSPPAQTIKLCNPFVLGQNTGTVGKLPAAGETKGSTV